MQVTGRFEYQLDVTQRELTLIGLALMGKLRAGQQEEAVALNLKLLEQYRLVHQQRVDMCTGTIQALGYDEET